MRVLLTSDQQQTCLALIRLFEREPEISVVGVVNGASELEHSLHETRPDLVLLDWDLPDLRTAAVFSTFRQIGRCIKVVAFSHDERAQQSALTAGADAFISRQTPQEWLLRLCRRMGQLSPDLVG
jgi:DNA-binding NarL/FixJ family response regulator